MKLLTFLGAAEAYVQFANGRRLTSLPKIADALQLYHELGDARNDLLHAGKRPGARESAVLERIIQGLCRRLDELPLPEE